MDILTEKYSESIRRLPSNGQHIIAHQSGESLVVYQAFRPSIANYAVENQKFGGVDYRFNRMSWVKPNFLWMMYRAGWANKEGQERILAIWIPKTAFDEMLDAAVISSYNTDYYATREDWKKAMSGSTVRLQWDPDHDPYGNKIERRAIQLGLKASALSKFVNQAIEKIEDITEFVTAQHEFVKSHRLEELLVPIENVYKPLSEPLVEKLKIEK